MPGQESMPEALMITEQPLEEEGGHSSLAGDWWTGMVEEAKALEHEVDKLADLLRRQKQNSEQARRKLLKEVIEELLDPVDHLLSTIDGEQIKGPAKNWFKRMQRSQQRLEALLARYHCEPLDLTAPPMGAVMVAGEEQRDDVPNGHILEVYQRGFLLEGAVFRPAQVMVARNDKQGN